VIGNMTSNGLVSGSVVERPLNGFQHWRKSRFATGFHEHRQLLSWFRWKIQTGTGARTMLAPGRLPCSIFTTGQREHCETEVGALKLNTTGSGPNTGGVGLFALSVNTTGFEEQPALGSEIVPGPGTRGPPRRLLIPNCHWRQLAGHRQQRAGAGKYQRSERRPRPDTSRCIGNDPRQQPRPRRATATANFTGPITFAPPGRPFPGAGTITGSSRALELGLTGGGNQRQRPH